jgi:hypothetical protein
VQPSQQLLLDQVTRPAYGIVMAVLFVGGTLAIWVMSGLRLVHARPRGRQQLAWLLAVVTCSFLLIFVISIEIPEPLGWIVAYLIPAAIAVGVSATT